MADNPKKTGEPDRSLIALGQDYEVRYWTQRFGVSESKLRQAVAAVGNSVSRVEQWLKTH
ncbi:DUF3606 domain-containing protein [Pseudoxanthomonas beigongshangi]|uniref:DUF3606 domain-containing protein n=1 Tax=Pseudoxanthomonas beigongshangi TaxID=2782537 RepID=UPI00193B5B4A|nr:DUF3606 domain-containing protein [Pseudoxanthomonas beigongshangi]